MKNTNYDRQSISSLCPRATAENKKLYEKDRLAKLGKATYYASKGRMVVNPKNRFQLLDTTKEYYEKKRKVKNKLNRLKLIKLVAEKELL